jgi:hypothetical protein
MVQRYEKKEKRKREKKEIYHPQQAPCGNK